ncbi:MAG: putative DNA metabolism protein [Flavobacteriales bacterium]
MPPASAVSGAEFLIEFDGSFEGWRALARRAVLAGVAPSQISWAPPDAAQSSLFSEHRVLPPPEPGAQLRVPRRYVEQARRASCHSSRARWDLFYRLLWRISRGAPDLIDDAPDRDVSKLRKLDAEVRRDCHKMKAFVRFRRLEDDEGEAWIAWHKPDHSIGRLVAAFFQDRFAPMRWSILMPNESLHWDTQRLRFGQGAQRSDAPASDELESLWRDYYRAIFNPARVKVAAMKAEMPMKHWSTLPEAQDIAVLLREAPARVARMVEHQHKDATPWLPQHRDVASLTAARPLCMGCARRCGEVREARNDERWPPFIGSAAAKVICVAAESTEGEHVGRVFARLREELGTLGIRPEDVSLTFAMKQQSASPTKAGELAKHVTACRPWLLAELQTAPSAHVLALGPLVARSVLGRHVAPAEAVGRQWEGFGMRAVWVIDGVRELSRGACEVQTPDSTSGPRVAHPERAGLDPRWSRTSTTLQALANAMTSKRVVSGDCETSR